MIVLPLDIQRKKRTRHRVQQGHHICYRYDLRAVIHFTLVCSLPSTFSPLFLGVLILLELNLGNKQPSVELYKEIQTNRKGSAGLGIKITNKWFYIHQCLSNENERLLTRNQTFIWSNIIFNAGELLCWGFCILSTNTQIHLQRSSDQYSCNVIQQYLGTALMKRGLSWLCVLQFRCPESTSDFSWIMQRGASDSTQTISTTGGLKRSLLLNYKCRYYWGRMLFL